MMTAPEKKDDPCAMGDNDIANPIEDEGLDPLVAHLFRAEIELHYALQEARTADDFKTVGLIEFALAAVQSSRDPAGTTAARACSG